MAGFLCFAFARADMYPVGKLTTAAGNVTLCLSHDRKCGRCGGERGGNTMKYCAQCGAQLVDEAVVCPKCGKPTRIAHKITDGKKARICKKCGAEL
mgnify:CR=1 FL=1